MLRSLCQRTLLLGLSLLGAIAPLAQCLHVVEERADKNAGAEVRYVLQSDLEGCIRSRVDKTTKVVEPTGTQKNVSSDKSEESKSQPRLIKLMPEHWDVGSSIELPIGDVLATRSFVAFEIFESRAEFAFQTLPYPAGPAPEPMGRGPPVV